MRARGSGGAISGMRAFLFRPGTRASFWTRFLVTLLRTTLTGSPTRFLGMECDGGPLSWVYGPLLTRPLDRKMDQSRRLAGSNYERGIEIVNRFNFKNVYVYAMGQEPWLNYIMSIKYSEQSNPIVSSN